MPEQPAAPVPPLIPAPDRVEARDGAPFRPDAATRVLAPTPALARAAADRIRTATGIEPAAADGPEGPSDLVLALDPAAPIPEGGYELAVDGGARILAADEDGLSAGIQTLFQLLVLGGGQAPPLVIADAPRFAHRGVMLDVARHFFDVDVVLRLIDRIAALRVNRLHLHLSDDQGWRLEIPGLPELTAKGATSQVGGGGGGSYSLADYRRILEHAQAHRIVVIPELDMPSHTNAALVAYPELAPEGYDPQVYEGTEVGFSTLDLGSSETDRFVQTVVEQVAAATPGPYLHIGGDEAHATDPHDYAKFLGRATRAVVAAGKIPLVWHEAGRSEDLAEGTIGQYWGVVGDEDAARAARAIVDQGGRLILSPADAVYLDIKPEPEHPRGLTWSAPTISLEQAHAWDPATLLDVPEEAILGVEAPLWTETITSEADIEDMLFPRLLAVAERAWTRAPGPWEEFSARADAFAPVLAALGVTPGPAGEGIRRHPPRA